MNFTARLRLHWQQYTWPERLFVLLPFLILTPRLLPHLNGGHNGEVSQEVMTSLAVWALLLVFGVTAYRNRRIVWSGRMLWVLLAAAGYALWSAASLFWTMDFGATQDHTVLWLNYTTLLFIASLVLRRRSAFGLIATLIMAGLGVAGFRLLQYWLTAEDRPLSSPIYLNLGVEPEILVTILPLLFTVQLTVRRRSLAWTALAVAAIVWMGSLSTYQRTPILALLVALSLLTFGLFRKWIVPHNKWRVVALVAVLSLAGTWQLSLPSKVQGWNPVPKESGKDFVVKQVKGIKDMEVDTSSRLQFWGTAIEMARAHPLLGIGAGAYKSGYVPFRRVANTHPYWGRVKDFSQLEGVDCTFRAHNEYMEVVGELGLIGLALLGALILALALFCWRTPPPQRWLVAGVSASAAAFLVSSGLTSYSFRWVPCGLTFFLLISVLAPFHKARRTAAPVSSDLSFQYGRWAWAMLAVFSLLSVGRTGQVFVSEYYQFQAQTQRDIVQEQGIALYQKALAIDPYNFSAAAELGSLFYRNNEPQTAINYLEYGTRHGINNLCNYAMLSFAYHQIGQPTRAREVMQEAAEAYPGSIFTRMLYVEALTKEGNLQAAREQRALMHAINAGESEVWELILQRGVQAATLTANQQRLPHPARLHPKVGMGILQERVRLTQARY